MKLFISKICWLVVFGVIAGCAAEVVRTEERFLSASGPNREIEMTKLAVVQLGANVEKRLFTGSRWQLVGTIQQGSVFKPVSTVFTIQGRNTHEAYLVLAETKLIGFYLPGERAWSPLEKHQVLEFKSVQ